MYLVFSQVLVDSDSAIILRVKGPLEFKCLLDSTDGTFTDISLLNLCLAEHFRFNQML